MPCLPAGRMGQVTDTILGKDIGSGVLMSVPKMVSVTWPTWLRDVIRCIIKCKFLCFNHLTGKKDVIYLQ